MKPFILAAVLALAVPSLALCETEKKEKESKADRVEDKIIKMEHDWADALEKSDLATIDRLVDPDWTLVDPAGALVTKAQSDADIKSGALKIESFKIEDLKVKVYGDTAIVWGLETEKSTYKGKDTSGQYRFTDVIVKRHGKWRAVATQVSRVVEHKD